MSDSLLVNGKQCRLVSQLFRPQNFRIRSFSNDDTENDEAAISNDVLDGEDGIDDELLGSVKITQTGTESSFLAKIAIALGIAATVTLISISIKGPPLGSSNGVQFLTESSSSSALAAAPVGFTFKFFGYSIVLPEYGGSTFGSLWLQGLGFSSVKRL